MRRLVLALLLGASACTSTPPSYREVPLSRSERHTWIQQERAIEDARTGLVDRYVEAHGLDPRTVLDPSRGLLIAPISSGS